MKGFSRLLLFCVDHNYLPNVLGQADLCSVDPDQMPQNVTSNQALNCLPLIWWWFFDISVRRHLDLFKF